LSQPHFQRVAHRGGAALAPENTLAAFHNALTLPVDAIELDVHLSHDGHAVVIHDNTVERLTEGKGNILDLDYAYLHSLNAATHFAGGWPDPQPIPTLGEVLALAKDHLQVYIEIKTSKRGKYYGRYTGIAEKVIDEVYSHNMLNDVLIMSFDWALLTQVKAIEPNVQTGALVSSDEWNFGNDTAHSISSAMDSLFKRVTALECNWINLDKKFFTPVMPTQMHKHGFKLGLWTVNSLREIQRFATSGVDSITSDRPDLFAKL
jgi:glycerophosphoryl diester phosphodiesterase